MAEEELPPRHVLLRNQTPVVSAECRAAGTEACGAVDIRGLWALVIV
jgi:hypothetical protein